MKSFAVNDENDPLPDARYRQILADAEAIAGSFANACYPSLAKHTSSAQRAGLAVEMACSMQLTEALRAHTVAIEERNEAIRQRAAAGRRPSDDTENQ